jgi:hypothetical protein
VPVHFFIENQDETRSDFAIIGKGLPQRYGKGACDVVSRNKVDRPGLEENIRGSDILGHAGKLTGAPRSLDTPLPYGNRPFHPSERFLLDNFDDINPSKLRVAFSKTIQEI